MNQWSALVVFVDRSTTVVVDIMGVAAIRFIVLIEMTITVRPSIGRHR